MYTKESPATKNLQQEKGRNMQKRWKVGVREGAVTLLGTQTWKTKAIDRESWMQHTEEAKDQFGLLTPLL
jgi:hypothetical protein